jgi:L-glyceraldehyde 3-phosphate reductase
VLDRDGIGCVVFSPLAQGLLTDRYLHGLPQDARAVRDGRFLKPEHITPGVLARVRKLDELARSRNQSLSQMALAWVLRRNTVTSALVGASSLRQIQENAAVLCKLSFSSNELTQIDAILAANLD